MPRDVSRSLARYYDEVGKAPLLDDADVEFGLILRWQQNKDLQARDILVRSHLRFVLREARKYATSDEQLEEYIGAGNIGLLEGVDRYDSTRAPRLRLLTYAYHWIRKNILDAHYREPAAHVPAHKIKAQKREAKEAQRQRSLGQNVDVPIAEGVAVALDTMLEAPAEMDPSRNHRDVDDAHMARHLRITIARLPPRDQTIVNLYYGMKDEPRTDNQIAKFLGLSPERARQLRGEAMGKLRELLKDRESTVAAAG